MKHDGWWRRFYIDETIKRCILKKDKIDEDKIKQKIFDKFIYLEVAENRVY